jgi:hypothetical protein
MSCRYLLGLIACLPACATAPLPAVQVVPAPVITVVAAPSPAVMPPARSLHDEVIDALCAARGPEASVIVQGAHYLALTGPCRADLDRVMYWSTYVREDLTLTPRVASERRPEL